MGIIIRQSIKGTLITYIGAFIGFLTTFFIVTKYINPEDFGLTTIILTAGMLFANIFQLGTSSSIIRFFPYFKTKDGKNNGFCIYLLVIPLVGFFIFIPLFFLLKEPIEIYFQKNSSLFVNYYNWLIPLTFFLLYWSVFETYSSALMRIVVPKFIREILVRLLMAAVFLLYAFDFINIDGFVASFVGVYGIAMLTTFFYVSKINPISLKRTPGFVTKPLRKDFLSYTSVLLIGSLGGTLVGKIDLLMIGSGINLASAGVYTIAFYMISIIDIPSRSLTAISSPMAAEALKAGAFETANQLYKKVSLHQLMIGSLIFLLIWINIDNIYKIIPNGAEYSEGKWVVLFIGISKIIELTIGFGGTLISFSKYYHWSIYFVFFISGITIVLNYLLIPIYGISGAALATALSCLISYGLQQWLIFAKIKANPYSSGTLKQIIVLFILLCISYLIPTLSNPYIDGIYRSVLIGALSVILLYVFRISPDISNLITQTIERIKKIV